MGAAGPGGDWFGRVITYLRRSCGGLGPLRSGKSGRATTRIGMEWLSVIPCGAVHGDGPHALVQLGVGLRVGGLVPELGL